MSELTCGLQQERDHRQCHHANMDDVVTLRKVEWCVRPQRNLVKVHTALLPPRLLRVTREKTGFTTG
jgi:hypothetical protein